MTQLGGSRNGGGAGSHGEGRGIPVTQDGRRLRTRGTESLFFGFVSSAETGSAFKTEIRQQRDRKPLI